MRFVVVADFDAARFTQRVFGPIRKVEMMLGQRGQSMDDGWLAEDFGARGEA